MPLRATDVHPCHWPDLLTPCNPGPLASIAVKHVPTPAAFHCSRGPKMPPVIFSIEILFSACHQLSGTAPCSFHLLSFVSAAHPVRPHLHASAARGGITPCISGQGGQPIRKCSNRWLAGLAEDGTRVCKTKAAEGGLGSVALQEWRWRGDRSGFGSGMGSGMYNVPPLEFSRWQRG